MAEEPVVGHALAGVGGRSVHTWPEHRGRGAYRALHEAVLAQARAADAADLRLYVDQRNSRAQEVYPRVGMDGHPSRVFEQLFEPLDG